MAAGRHNTVSVTQSVYPDAQVGGRERELTESSKSTSSDTSPPTRFTPPNPSPKVPSTGDQVFKYMSCRAILIHTTTNTNSKVNESKRNF